jgi:Flp pilus assembly protein TadB
MTTGSRQRRIGIPHAAIAACAGAAFAIVALVNAPAISYAIVAIVAGLCYTLVAMANRRRD